MSSYGNTPVLFSHKVEIKNFNGIYKEYAEKYNMDIEKKNNFSNNSFVSHTELYNTNFIIGSSGKYITHSYFGENCGSVIRSSIN